MERITWNYNSAILFYQIISSCHAITLESVYWNSSNTKFIPGQGLILFPQIGDKMDIVCPQSGGSPRGKEEFYRVYLVTLSQMETCIINKADTPLLNCDKPHRDVKFTFKFQEFSPNLWGLEFLKGRDYYITSTSTGSLRGLDNADGGVCRTKSMKLVLRVGQSSSDPPSVLQESPTRFPPKLPKAGAKDPNTRRNNVKTNVESTKKDMASEDDVSHPGGTIGDEGSGPGVLIGIVSGCVLLILVIVALLTLLWKYHQRHSAPDNQQSASMSLNTLAMPKRDSIGSDNNGSDRSDIVFPLRASESMFCRHYERVSSDYGPPVYIVQEIPPQSPTNVYYKV